MPILAWIIAFSLLGGLLSLLLAALFLKFPQPLRDRLLPGLVSVAIGTLLGAAFLGLLPEALTSGEVDIDELGATVVVGILIFFLLEKMVIWRHSHDHVDAAHEVPQGQHNAGALILVGDAIHNLVDGVLIAAAFMTDIQLGIVTSIAVASHELPQELGDFAILLNAGWAPTRALLANVATSFATVLGAILAYYTLADAWLPYVLALAAASFVYVAVADLIPGLQRSSSLPETLRQVILISAGVLMIYAGHALVP